MTQKERSLKHYRANKELYNERAKQWRKDNPDKINEINKKWRDKNPDKVKGIKLKQRYGISLEDFNDLLQKQNNSCAICFREKELHVDHDHATGEVRGLLCGLCNRGLGTFEDNIDFLQAAISYIKVRQKVT